MKAKATVYKGIEFICVGELPADQQLLLKHSQQPERIKILIDGKIQRDCIQFSHYCDWYEVIYTRSVATIPQIEPETSLPVNVSFVKA
jgi:hypothetical protein